MVRQRVVDIAVVGRSGMGVRLVRLSEGASLVSVSVAAAEEVEETPPADDEEPPASPGADPAPVDA